MASNTSKEQIKRSGKDTEEYKVVISNMDKTIDAIDANPEAKERLARKFMENEWLSPNVKLEDLITLQLFQQALNRIENNAEEYDTFFTMLTNIIGLNHILPNLKLTKEESIPTQSRELVSGKTDRRPPTVLPPHLTMKATNAGPNSGKGATWLERDSGCVATTPPCPRRPPPGTIPHPSEAASGFIPETSPQGNDGSSNYFAGIPVPSSTAENTNTEAQQQKSDVAEYPVFTVGSNAEISTENEPVPFQPEVSTENETDGPDTATKPVEEISKKTHLEKMDVAGAAVYLSPGIIDRLEEQKQQIEELKQQLKAQIEVKETLQEERDELQHTLQQYQQNVEAQIAISEEKIKEKEKELQKCKEQITKMKTDYREEVAKVEREKREIESQHQKVVAELEEEIANLKKEREDKKQRTEVEMLRLETRLHKAEKELAEKENLILRKEKTIAELEKKIAVESKDAEIQKLKQENRELRRGKSLSHSLSDLKIEGR